MNDYQNKLGALAGKLKTAQPPDTYTASAACQNRGTQGKRNPVQ